VSDDAKQAAAEAQRDYENAKDALAAALKKIEALEQSVRLRDANIASLTDKNRDQDRERLERIRKEARRPFERI
jgi:hypothetical protein